MCPGFRPSIVGRDTTESDADKGFQHVEGWQFVVVSCWMTTKKCENINMPACRSLLIQPFVSGRWIRADVRKLALEAAVNIFQTARRPSL
jgi:hypothetical protein